MSFGSPGLPPVFLTKWLKIRGSYNPLHRFDNLLEQLTELKETLTSRFRFYCITKTMRNNPNEEPDEQIHKASSRSVLRAGTQSWGAPLACHMIVSPSQKLSKPHTFGIFMEASSVWHNQSWIILPKGWGKSWTFQVSGHGLVFLVTSPIPKLSRSPPRVTLRTNTLTPIT